MHEYSHGMGLSVGLIVDTSSGIPILRPYNTVTNEDGTITYPPNLFNMYVEYVHDGRVKPIKQYFFEFNKLMSAEQIASRKHKLISVNKKLDVLEALNHLYKIASSSHPFVFKAHDGTNILLDAKNKHGFIKGRTLSHLSDDYIGTQETLMIYDVSPGQSMENILPKRTRSWKTYPYGPLTIKLFETLGYTVNPALMR